MRQTRRGARLPATIPWTVLTTFVLCALSPRPTHADTLPLLSLGVRARFTNEKVLGVAQPEKFREYDAVASLGLPWEHHLESGWGVGTRLLASAGALQGEKNTALVISVIPVLALGKRGGRFTIDAGAGGALLSRHRFAKQDFGGHFQFALTSGVTVPVSKRFGAGYRFLHYSDANIYGRGNLGSDFHMVELIYGF